MKRLIIELCCAIALVACGNSQEPKAGEEDLRAKSLLQGIWIEDETELPLMRIEGDTIYYTDPQNIPVSFKIIRDTMYVYGNNTAAYKIDRQTEYSFWFHSLADEIVKLHKSENPEDILAFENKEVEVIPITEVMGVCLYQPLKDESYPHVLFGRWNQCGQRLLRQRYTYLRI